MYWMTHILIFLRVFSIWETRDYKRLQVSYVSFIQRHLFLFPFPFYVLHLSPFSLLWFSFFIYIQTRILLCLSIISTKLLQSVLILSFAFIFDAILTTLRISWLSVIVGSLYPCWFHISAPRVSSLLLLNQAHVFHSSGIAILASVLMIVLVLFHVITFLPLVLLCITTTIKSYDLGW